MTDSNVISIGSARPVAPSMQIDIQRAVIQSELIPLILDDTPEGAARASTLRTKDAELAKLFAQAKKREAKEFDGDAALQELAEAQVVADQAALEAKIDAFIIKENYHYVRSGDCFWYKSSSKDPESDGNGDWDTATRSTLDIEFPEIANRAVRVTFNRRLAKLNRIFQRTVSSFRPQPVQVLNLTSRDNFAKPVDEPHHWIFDILLHAIGGGKAENVAHIEQLLLAKWQHPENYILPALVITDPNGGSGKSTLASTMLGGLFGREIVASNIMMKDITGDFTAILRGKAIAFVNEAAKDETNFNALKAVVGSADFVCNEKFVKKFVADNTALYIIVGNHHSAVVRLMGTAVDRRWSIVKTKLQLMDCVREALSADLDRDVPMSEADLWFTTIGKPLLSNRVECGKWLNSQIGKYGDLVSLSALHGGDYNDAVKDTRPLHTQVFETIFDTNLFTGDRGGVGIIKQTTVGEFYRHIAWRDGIKFPLSKPGLVAELRAWLTINRPDLVFASVKEGSQRTNKTVIHHVDVTPAAYSDEFWRYAEGDWLIDIE